MKALSFPPPQSFIFHYASDSDWSQSYYTHIIGHSRFGYFVVDSFGRWFPLVASTSYIP
jgi:hypothetical protein